LKRLLIVAIGGALGAMARHALGSLVARVWAGPFPLGTWIINVTGSLIIGAFLTLYGERAAMHPHWRLLIAVGFVGAFTTFSTFEYETLQLIETGRATTALLYVGTSLLVGLLAVWAGVAITRRLLLYL
jgi:CrcB protein